MYTYTHAGTSSSERSWVPRASRAARCFSWQGPWLPATDGVGTPDSHPRNLVNWCL